MRKLHKNKKIISGIVLAGIVVGGGVAAPLVHAQNYQAQINALSQQNSQKQGNLSQLGSEAANYQDAINKAQAEIANLQAQIQANESLRAQTVQKISDAEAELAKQKATLADNLKVMYVDGQMSNLEQLASSKNLSDYADQEQYHSSVQHKIQNTLDTIKQLQTKLATDKANLERMIANQQQMQSQVAAQQAEQARLLSMNQAQQADLNNQIQANNSQISDLRKQQAAENARLASASSAGGRSGAVITGVPGGGGYPGKWAFAPMDSVLDDWGMYNRECVSYTAWRVAASGRYMPYWGGKGNAKQWDDNARAAGIPVDGSPRAGDVAISNAGTWGHAMYVEQVGSDGSINVSDYNQQYDGLYRNYWISASTVASKDLQFIHF